MKKRIRELISNLGGKSDIEQIVDSTGATRISL